jgi:23S rRNA (cytosine1962-C5)-methyltransferase
VTKPLPSEYPVVVLKPGREKPVRQRHPWIFSGAISAIAPAASDGEIVDVRTTRRARFWRAAISTGAARFRCGCLLGTRRSGSTPISGAPGARGAGNARALPEVQGCTALRLVNAESDYLPGLTVDRFGDFLVLQAGTLAIDRRKQELADLLLAESGARA